MTIAARKKLNDLAKRASSPRVVFRIEPDACETCRRLTMRGGIPRVFKKSTLLDNGSNRGRKQSEWRATIPPLHVNCKCTLEPA